MSSTENLINKDAIDKLKSLVDDIMICLFCTNLKTDDGATCRPMSAIKVCDRGNIWFFSEKSSDKNKAIGNRMINILKMVASVVTGTNLVNSSQGSLKI